MNSFQRREGVPSREILTLSWLQHITQSALKLLAARVMHVSCVISSICLKMKLKFELLKLHIYISFSVGDQQFTLRVTIASS